MIYARKTNDYLTTIPTMTSCNSTHQLSISICHLLVLVIDTDALLVPLVEAVDAFVNFYCMMPSKLVEFAYIR